MKLKLKIKNAWIIFGFVILFFLILAYHFYSKPYELLAAGLKVTADFPSKPVFKQISNKFSNDISSGVRFYELSKPEITYFLSITQIKPSVRVSLTDSTLLNKYYQGINLLPGEKQGSIQPIFFQDYNGQSILMTTKTKLLFGQFFLTSKFIVAIFVRHNGNLLRQDGRAFIDSLTISESNELEDVFR